MVDLATVVPAAGFGSIITFLGNAALQRWTARDKVREVSTKAAVTLEKQRDDLMFKVLETAQNEAKVLRDEITMARAEAAISRHLQDRLAHFTEALDHIAALLSAGTVEEKKASDKRATAFLNRMRRLAEVEGALRNEAQITASERALNDTGAALAPRPPLADEATSE